jgi:hypothetical protein
MEAICCSETSVDFQRTTRRYIPEDITLHNHRCENLKFYTTRDIFYAISVVGPVVIRIGDSYRTQEEAAAAYFKELFRHLP